MSFKVRHALAKLKRSWTLYFNLVSALLAGAEMQFHLLKDVIGEEAYPIAYFSLIMINIALRFKTELNHLKEKTDESGQVV